MPIVQGDNGRIIEDTFPEPLTGATIEIVIKAGSRTILKAGEIVDAAAGTYKFTLTNSDLAKSGYYMYQTTATYSDGRVFSNEPQRFIVSGKIIVDISDPGNEIADSDNGFLLVNGVKLNVYDDSELRNLIEELRTQIGTGTGGEEIMLVQKDVIEGTGNTTVSYTGDLYGFNILNKIASEIEFYINGKRTPVDANGTYEGTFDAFDSVTINTTGAFWAEVKGKLGETVTRITDGEQPPADTTAPVVSASLAAGTYNSAQTVTLSSNETATIYYTTNGSTPTEASAVYSSVISIGATTTLKFFGKDSAGNSSAVQTIVYTIDLTTPDTTAPTVTASPAGGTFTSVQSVTLSANETATIYYTTDGSTPTTSSTVYSAPISVSANTTLKFFGKDTAGNASVVQTQVYTIDATAPSYVTDGLKIHYDFTKYATTPATVTDESGNGNTGTLFGYAGTTTSGINNGELIGDGNGDYIQIPHNSTLKTYPFTIEYYAKIHSSQPTSSTSFRIFDNRYGATGTGNGVTALIGRSTDTTYPNKLLLQGNTSNPNYAVDFTSFDDVYRHIVIVFGANSQKVYIDGTLIGNASQTSTTLGTRDIFLFTTGNSAGTTSVANSCKAFRFYNKELTQSEVTQNYNAVTA